MYFLTHAVYW